MTGPDPGGAGPGPKDRPPPRGRRIRRRRKIVIAVLLLSAVAGGAVAAGLGLGPGGETAAGSATGALPPATATVKRQTLADRKSVDGELGYWPTATMVSRLGGTLTRLPKAGREIGRGEALYAVDDRPVLLLYGKVPAYRALAKGAKGRDVRQLEGNLSALGYSGFTIDERFSAQTARAVKRWQDDLGEKRTGRVDLGRIVFLRGKLRVESLSAQRGDPIGPGAKVFTHTGTAKAVTVELDPSDQRLARKDSEVTVELPDGGSVDGRVTSVTTVVKPAEEGRQNETAIKVAVALTGDGARRAVRGYTRATVRVAFTVATRKDVLAVPVAALAALSEGGFGLEVVKGRTTRYVPVTTGLFADGLVEVTGTGITEGTVVGMPE